MIVCMNKCKYGCIRMHECLYMYVWLYVGMYEGKHIRTIVCMHCMYVGRYDCMYATMIECMYIVCIVCI